MNKILIGLFYGFVFTAYSTAQSLEEITLTYCYERIETDYPASRKIELQEKIASLNSKIRQSGLYPEVLISGSASYQSEVTNIAFGGAPGPSLSKDHYNISVDVNQAIFDGGRTNNLREIERVSGKVQQAGVRVELWNIRNQVNQVYFGILLIQKQKETLELLLKDLNEQQNLVASKVKNGILLPSNELILKAEILKIRQQLVEVISTRNAGHKVLSEIIGKELSTETKLLIPVLNDFAELKEAESARPEWEVFAQKKNSLDAQIDLNGSEKLPTISAFAKTSYGRPGFDVFDDDLHFYWVAGLKAQWSFRNWRNSEKKAQVFQIQKEQTNADKDTFEQQLNASLNEAEQRIYSVQEQIELDEELVQLRKEIMDEKSSQLNQGVITSTEYVNELNELSRARLNLEIHKIQLIQAKNEYSTKKGISWK